MSAPAQTGDDAATFAAARAETAPEARIEAFRRYLQEFPSGIHNASAKELLLTTYLSDFPDRSEAIHSLATAQVAEAPPGFERWTEQARIADMLASAEPTGADLGDAQTWANAALAALTEPAYRREMATMQARYKLPKVTPHVMHEQFVHERTAFLAAAAHVDLRTHRDAEAATLLTEAFRLDPLSPEVNALRGELALDQGQDRVALDQLERADAMGALNRGLRSKELELFQQLEHGNADALDAQIDKVYSTLYPAVFQLPHRRLPTSGHTALLEIFTGSGCEACAGVDLAADSLLASYAPQDLAILEFDQHIPRPDPLANPDSVARAGFYAVGQAPEAYLDGQPVQVLGSSRTDVENIVISLADAIEDQAALPSGVGLRLNAARSPENEVKTEITLATTPVPQASAGETTGDTSLRALSRAQVFVALAQDHVRYSGENGVRFHRMVVRSLHVAPAATFLGSSTAAHTVRFDLSAITKTISAYLEDYETSNDRFGTFQFRSKDIPIRPDQLTVVAWVQDPVTRHVLQAAFASVSPD